MLYMLQETVQIINALKQLKTRAQQCQATKGFYNT